MSIGETKRKLERRIKCTYCQSKDTTYRIYGLDSPTKKAILQCTVCNSIDTATLELDKYDFKKETSE